MLTASFALAVGADSAQAAGPDIQAASDTLTITLAAPEGGTVAEGTTGHFVVSVAGSTVAGAVNVRYSIAGTAVAGEDYTALSGEVTVAQGENVARIALEAIQDSILDKGETVVLALTGVTASAAAWVFEHAAKTATIADNGSVTVALTAVPDTISEGAAWRSTVTMSTAVADRVSVRWWTNDGTAVAGQDYTAADAEVVFQPGETSKPIQVQTLEDDNAEAVEFFYVSLNPPSISTSAATLGAMTVNGDALSAFIECSIRFPQRGPIVFRLNDPVAAGTVVDTVAAEASGIADYFLTGGDNKFTINARGEIRTTAALVAGRRYELAVTAVDHCDAKASVDVTVIVNSSPRKVGTIPDAAVEEEESGLVDVSDYFSDPDGNRLTYTATSSDTTVLKVRVSGSDVTFTGVSAGNASVTVTATDPGGLLAQQTFTVTVEEPNDPPVVERPLADLTLYVGEPPNDAEIDISGVFKDPDGDALGYTANSSDTDVATATLTGSTLTVTATGKGNATVTVTATDPGGLAAQDTFEVSVPNRAPTCTAIPSQEVDAGQIVRVDLANLCSDDDGDELTFGGENSDDTDVATVSLKGSVLTITGVSSGSANVKATADDDNGGSVNTSGPVTVTQPNRAPVVEDEIEDLTLHVGDPPNEEEIDLSDVFSDPDGDVLGYTAVSSNTAVATATVDGHTLTVTATGKGRTTVTVTATDPGDLSAVDEFDVEVPNREPTVAEAIADLTLYVGDPPNKTAINISGVFEDADGDVLRYTVNVANTNVATATLSGNTLTVTAAGKGRTRVTLTADDRMGGTKADVFQVDVPNRGPTAEGTISDRTVYVGESRSLDVARYFDDPDGDDLTYTPVSSDTDKLTVSGTGSRVRFRGVAVGSATVTVTATDTGNLTATQQFDVEVYAEQPTCTIRVSNADLPVREDAGAGAALTPDVSVDATDCGTLRYALTGTGSGDFSVAAAGANDDDARIRVARTLNHEGRDTYGLTLTVSEVGSAASGHGDVDISVTDVNEPPRPSGTIRRQTVRVGQPVSLDVTGYFTDEDAGDRLTFTSASSATGKLTVNAAGSPVRLTGVAAGSATVTVTARDRGGLTATQTIPVTVVPRTTTQCGITVSDGDLDVREDAGAGAGVDGVVTVTTSGNCGTLGYSLSGDGSGDFSVAAVGSSDNDAKIRVAGALDFETRASYALTLTVSSGTVSAEGDVDISVTDVNEAPEVKSAISAREVEAGASEAVVVSPHFSDPDGDALTYTAESSTASVATVSVSRDTVLVAGVSKGSAEVTVTALDPDGASVSQRFDVTVADARTANRAPVFGRNSTIRYVAENSPGGTLVGEPVTATDPDGDTLSYSLTTGGDSGRFDIEAETGRLTVEAGAALDHERQNTLVVQVVASDGALADTITVGLRITDVPVPGRLGKPAVKGGAGAVTATWEPLADESLGVTGYDLRHRPASATGWTEVSLGLVLTHTAADLEAGTAYVVEVRAVSPEGAGEWSEPGGAATAPAFDPATVTRSVPENSAGGTAVGAPVTAEAEEGTELTYGFAGTKPALFDIGAATGQITVAAGAVLDYESGTTAYSVQVRASDGTLADTASVTIGVTDVPAPGKPDAPTVAGGAEEVSLSWSAPENEGPAITGYDLQYRARGESGWTGVSSPGAALSFTITGLKAGTTHQVQVRAVSSEGAGEWSDSGEGATAEANEAPAFAADTYEREVAENSPGGTAVGEPVTATDPDGDGLTYSLIPGEDGVPFEIDSATGQIEVADGAALDHEGDTNTYTARLAASDGTLADTASVTIQVTDVPAPGKPTAPTVVGGTEEVAVSWTAPDNEGPAITGYDLQYRARGESGWTDASSPGAALSLTIEGLKAGTTYEVQVRAVSSEGAGEWSESGEGTTERANEAPVFAADAYEREVAENSTGGTAVGEPVTATDPDGDGLTYSLIPGADAVPFEIDSTTGQIEVADGAALDHEGDTNTYTAQLAASDGTLADTVGVTILVTDVPAPGKPDAPTVVGGTEEVSVSWTAPDNEGPEITGYDLQYRAQGESGWTEASPPGAALSLTITGLKAGTTYEVQVRAVSSEGAGEWSESGEGTTERANQAPVFAADAYEREVAENSPGGTAVGEPVTATDADDDELTYSLITGEDGIPFEIGSTTGQLAVADGAALDHEGETNSYTVAVVATDETLADTASVTIRVTDVAAPGRPDAPTVTGGAAEVAVSWIAPDNDGPEITGYDLQYRAQGESSWTEASSPDAALSLTITGLKAGTTYQFQVRAVSSEGAGEWSESGEGTTAAANQAPVFGADAYEREVPENSPGGTRVGRPVRATDGDGDELVYGILAGGNGAPFEINPETGRIKVADDAALNYESADTLFTVLVEASDGTLADTASVTIRVTDADEPGKVTLSPEVARAGVELTMTLMDEDGVRDLGKRRMWQRSRDGSSWNDIATGRRYTPVTTDEGRWLRAVFTYTDRHGPGKRAASAAVKVLPANAKPSFGAVYEREVPENSPGGTAVGAPVAATDPDNTSLSYSFAEDGDDVPFGIDSSTGQITVGADAALDYESGDTLYTVSVEATDGELADTASVKIRVTNADDPGKIALSADVARVGVRLTATLMDQDRSIERSKMRTWQRSSDGAAWTMVVQGAARRFYTPTDADEGKYLRAVFTYTDGHGPGKRAESPAVMVVGATTPVVSFGADSYTAAPGGSADVAVLLSPAASGALAIEVVAGDGTHTVTFQAGASTATLAVSTSGLSAADTVAVRFGNLPEGVAVGVPATTRIIVAATAGDRVSRSVVEDDSPTELEVEYAQTEYEAVAGGPGTEITLRVSPAADRRVAVPLTATQADSMEPMLPDSVVFEPGDSLAAFMLEVPAGTGSGLLALGFGALPEAVSAGAVSSATVDIADHDPGPLRDEAFDLGLAVFGRAVAEGARQAVGARIDAVMRPAGSGSGTEMPGSATEWAGRAAGTLASLTGAPLSASSAADMARRSGSVDLPTGREAARRLLPNLSFATALGPQSAQGRPRIGLWAEGSAQSFRGEPGIDYDGGLRALTVGADARIGSSALLGVSLMRSDGDLDYSRRSAKGSLGHAMNSVHPYLFLQPSPGIGLWAMAGYGSGDVRDGNHHGDSGASLRMLSGGVKVPLARSGAFGLALNGDAFTVGMSAEDGQREGSASRARALLEASWTAGGLKLATQAGARYDGGDADTGGGAETGASVGYAAHGLDLDLRGRLGLGSGRHREWGAALRLAFDPGTRGEGFRLAVSPRHGRDQSGVHGLMDGGTFHAMTPATGRDWRLDAEAGYGLKSPGAGGALDSYTRLSADGRNRSWSFGSRYSVSQTLRLGIEGSRSQLPGQHPNIGLRLALDFTF